MCQSSEQQYHLDRARDERERAASSASPAIRHIHLELAARHSAKAARMPPHLRLVVADPSPMLLKRTG